MKRLSVGEVVRDQRAPTSNLPVGVRESLADYRQRVGPMRVQGEERRHPVLAILEFGDELFRRSLCAEGLSLVDPSPERRGVSAFRWHLAALRNLGFGYVVVLAGVSHVGNTGPAYGSSCKEFLVLIRAIIPPWPPLAYVHTHQHYG